MHLSQIPCLRLLALSTLEEYEQPPPREKATQIEQQQTELYKQLQQEIDSLVRLTSA